MEDDPKKEALLILGKMKPGKDGDDTGSEGEEGGMSASAALKDMWSSMKSGDFDAAADALRGAMMALEDEP